jgi:hypothetical protein
MCKYLIGAAWALEKCRLPVELADTANERNSAASKNMLFQKQEKRTEKKMSQHNS